MKSPITIVDFLAKKRAQEKISMITCYDYWSAQVINQSEIDSILVGDSLAMIMHGHANTIPATVELMALHVAAVSRGAPEKFIIADLPFLTMRYERNEAVRGVHELMKSGSHAVKVEGLEGQEEHMRHLVASGIPVMGHIGLTPQSFHSLGGFRVQGRSREEAEKLKRQALQIQEIGCFSLVLECVTAPVAREISEQLEIPTIGIGAGAGTDGQVLVLQDMLNLFKNIDPRFVRRYLDGHGLILDALNRFSRDVESGSFPSAEESYQ